MWPLPDTSRQRAVTLIEVLVVSILVVVVTGIVLGFLIDTRKAVERGQAELALRGAARQIAEEVIAVFDAAVKPVSLDDNITTLPLRFAPDHCALVSSRNFNGQDFYLTVINDVETRAGSGRRVMIGTKVFDPARMSLPVREEVRSAGVGGDHLSATIRFEYAREINPVGLEPFFVPELKPGEYPHLIRVLIEVKDLEDPSGKPYRFHSTVRLL